MNTIDEKTGKPPVGYTDAQWQKDFLKVKEKIQPSNCDCMYTIKESSYENQTYHGKTQYQCYCDFINDILSNIRNGGTDYCFYIYQVSDLLKYEYDRLQTRWIEEDQCFSVHLKTF